MEIAESSVCVKKTYVRCCVKECKSKVDDRNSNISFHLFPKPNKRFVCRENYFGAQEKLDILDAWKLNLKINHFASKMRVCSLHFKKEDYFFPDIAVQRRYLKKNAVPSCNLPTCYGKQKDEKKNADRLQRKNAQPEKTQNLVFKMNECKQITNKTNTILHIPVEEIKQELEDCNDVLTGNVQTTVNAETQVNDCDFLQESIVNNIKTDAELSTVTGIRSFEIPDKIVQINTNEKGQIILNNIKTNAELSTATGIRSFEIADRIVQINTNEKGQSILNNIKTNAELSTVSGIRSFKLLDTIVQMVKKVYGNRFEDRTMKLKTKERIIMLYTKLKQNSSYSFLAIMFNMYTAKHIQRICEEMIIVLSTVLKVSISWSQNDIIQSNLPKCLEGFEDIRVIPDLTEDDIQDPKKICFQIITKAISLQKL